MLTFKILGLLLSLTDSTGCTVDRVEGSVAVLSCDTVDALNVDASYVGVEGTVYGTVDVASAHYDGSTGKVVL